MPHPQSPEEVQAFFQERFRGNFNELVGLELLEAGHGFARFRLPLRSELLQPGGSFHGGAVATLADVTAGVAAHLTHPPGSVCVTVELKLNYLRRVSDGALISVSELLHLGGRTSAWQVRISEEGGPLAAFATATFMVVGNGGAGEQAS